MSKYDNKKQNITEDITSFILSEGLHQASLRKMALAANISDRMLLHYFKDKEEILIEVLTLIEKRISLNLANTIKEKMHYTELIIKLSTVLADTEIKPYFKVALELAIETSKQKSYGSITTSIFENYFNWICSVILVEKEEDRVPAASLVFAITEGFVLLDTVNAHEIISNAIKHIEKSHKL